MISMYLGGSRRWVFLIVGGRSSFKYKLEAEKACSIGSHLQTFLFANIHVVSHPLTAKVIFYLAVDNKLQIHQTIQTVKIQHSFARDTSKCCFVINLTDKAEVSFSYGKRPRSAHKLNTGDFSHNPDHYLFKFRKPFVMSYRCC